MPSGSQTSFTCILIFCAAPALGQSSRLRLTRHLAYRFFCSDHKSAERRSSSPHPLIAHRQVDNSPDKRIHVHGQNSCGRELFSLTAELWDSPQRHRVLARDHLPQGLQAVSTSPGIFVQMRLHVQENHLLKRHISSHLVEPTYSRVLDGTHRIP